MTARWAYRHGGPLGLPTWRPAGPTDMVARWAYGHGGSLGLPTLRLAGGLCGRPVEARRGGMSVGRAFLRPRRRVEKRVRAARPEVAALPCVVEIVQEAGRPEVGAPRGGGGCTRNATRSEQGAVPVTTGREGWLSGLDSNQDKLLQRELCYLYTTGQWQIGEVSYGGASGAPSLK
jgi:hypothetical protein